MQPAGLGGKGPRKREISCRANEDCGSGEVALRPDRGKRAEVLLLRRLYDWVLSWADSPFGTWALFALAVAEASFFPVPPDVLLIALALGAPRLSLFFAFVCSVGSVVGGVAGYGIGAFVWSQVSDFFFRFVFTQQQFDYVAELYRSNAFLAVFAAGFTPIPYKVFTLAAGVCEVNFPVFLVASVVSRSARFFIVGGLIAVFGAPIKAFIDRYFNALAILFFLLLAGGFVVIRAWTSR